MALISNFSEISRSLMLLSIIIDFSNYLINASINSESIRLVILSSLYSYSNLSRRSLILVVNIINFVNFSSRFSVIKSLRRIMLIRIISSSIYLARESLSHMITTFKTIKIIRHRRIKIIKKTLISRYQLY